ncbi:heterocyst frequency control protein PatD [Waterburya agarophytonicola K14]|uniref:Heterocyst frequency control protein PatD n=1 Tax=Waterburya agarophytonicola KI4 TaxID=2874699 RepID=A0A964FDH7_9CYAN|nr:heterocyst frequency control protein PatD [Waterburya agarophytonicola]MCC0175585.1 heterocyst frequency control protein PatD [Waterburya agarophytonicola KI4]
MLPGSHNRAYQDFLTLLTVFNQKAIDLATDSAAYIIQQEFPDLQQWFEENIVGLDCQEINPAIIPRWESIQREIKREFKLLATDILFLAAARRDDTKSKKLKNISSHTTKLIGYCQGLLKNEK